MRAAVAAGVRDDRVLEALRAVPRAAFVPADLVHRAYVDAPLPIPHGQVTTQPSLVARMVEAARVRDSDTVLEIGTGYGFQTAVLAHLARRVYSIERHADIARTAAENLRALPHVEVVVGDGSVGLPDHAPYGAIVVSAAYLSVPPPLARQLAEGGRLVQPIGPGGAEDVRIFTKRDGRLVDEGSVTGAHFVRLYGEHGFPPGEAPD